MLSAADGDDLGMECGFGSTHCMKGCGILLDDKESVVFEQLEIGIPLRDHHPLRIVQISFSSYLRDHTYLTHSAYTHFSRRALLYVMQTVIPFNSTLKVFIDLNFAKCPFGSDRADLGVKNEYNEPISGAHTGGDREDFNVWICGWRWCRNPIWIRIHSLCEMMWDIP